MAALDMQTRGEISTTVQVLPRVVRHVTGHNVEGKSIFLSTDNFTSEPAIATIIHSTYQQPAELNGGLDVSSATQLQTESAWRMVDFAPGSASPMQHINSPNYAIVMEGVLKMVLDSGEERIMQRGEIAVQQSTAHRWINVTGDGLLPARLLVVPVHGNESSGAADKLQKRQDLPRRDSLWQPSQEIEDGQSSGKFAQYRQNDFWESEF